MTEIIKIKNFVGGEFVDSESGFLESIEPATGIVWAHVPDSGEKEIHHAVTAASTAFLR